MLSLSAVVFPSPATPFIAFTGGSKSRAGLAVRIRAKLRRPLHSDTHPRLPGPLCVPWMPLSASSSSSSSLSAMAPKPSSSFASFAFRATIAVAASGFSTE